MSEEALKENKMGVMPMPKLMLSMGLPMIISMIVQAFYNIVDSYFVSRITDDTVEHIGEYAVNALTLAYPVPAFDNRCRRRHRRWNKCLALQKPWRKEF